MRKIYNNAYDWFMGNAMDFALALAVIAIVLFASGCSSTGGKIVDVATVPGTDKRCLMGFCYEREREVDVEGLEALTEYLKAKGEE